MLSQLSLNSPWSIIMSSDVTCCGSERFCCGLDWFELLWWSKAERCDFCSHELLSVFGFQSSWTGLLASGSDSSGTDQNCFDPDWLISVWFGLLVDKHLKAFDHYSSLFWIWTLQGFQNKDIFLCVFVVCSQRTSSPTPASSSVDSVRYQLPSNLSLINIFTDQGLLLLCICCCSLIGCLSQVNYHARCYHLTPFSTVFVMYSISKAQVLTGIMIKWPISWLHTKCPVHTNAVLITRPMSFTFGRCPDHVTSIQRSLRTW